MGFLSNIFKSKSQKIDEYQHLLENLTSVEKSLLKANKGSEDVVHLVNQREQLLKSLAVIERDKSVKDEISRIKSYRQFLTLYKSRDISKQLYNKIIREKLGKTRFADMIVQDSEGKILLLHRFNNDRDEEKGEWCLPGGHVDPNEDFKQAAIRELKEETMLEPDNEVKLIGVHDTDDTQIEYYLTELQDKNEPVVILESEEHDGYQWVFPYEIGKYDLIYDLQDNLNKFFNLCNDNAVIITKALAEGRISYELYTECISKSNKHYFSEKEREKLAKEGEAMPGGQYPIRNKQDLMDAIKLVGASNLPESEVKAWIRKRAKELGLEDQLPESWGDNTEKAMGVDEAEILARESLDGETADGKVEKSNFSLRVDFDDLECADIFKSVLEKYSAEGKLGIQKVEPFEKSLSEEKSLFNTYLNFIEGIKTRLKNIHWGEKDNSKHVYLDDLSKDVSEFEDKMAEAGQSGFGRFKAGEIQGDEIDESDPVKICQLIFDRTVEFRKELEGKDDFDGEISWIDDFLASLKQTKYRLQMH